jgi:hypothetical protein
VTRVIGEGGGDVAGCGARTLQRVGCMDGWVVDVEILITTADNVQA